MARNVLGTGMPTSTGIRLSDLRTKSPVWVGYAFAVLTEVLFALGLGLLAPYLPLYRFPVIYVVTVTAIAYFFGTGPAMVALLMSCLAFVYLFVPPTHVLWPPANSPEGWASIVAVIIGSLVGILWATAIRESQSRVGRLAAQLMEANSELAAEVAQRKQAEEDLRRSRERLRLAADAAEVGIWCLDLDRNDLIVDEKSRALFGLPPDNATLSYELFLNAVYPDDRQPTDEAVRRALAEHREYDFEYRTLWPDGTVRWIHAKGRGFYDETGRPTSMMGVVIDITRRKQDEEALRDATQRLNSMIENSPLALVEWDQAHVIVRWTREAEQVFGWTADEAVGKHLEDLHLVHEEDLDHMEQIMAEMVSGMIAQSHVEKRNIRKDGANIWCDWYNSPISDSSGKVVAVESLILDITERKQAEELRARLASIVESSDDAIIGKTLEGVVTSWNKGAESIYGYTADEMIGRQVSIVAPPDHNDIPDILARIGRGEAVVHYDTVRVKKDGTRIFVSLTVSPIEDAQGRIVGASTVARDVTDRIRAEQRERELEIEQMEFYRRTIKAATNGKLVVTDRAEIEKLAGPVIASWQLREGQDLTILRHGVAEIARTIGMDEQRVGQFVMCIGEATTNALKHAGSGVASLHRVGDDLIFVVSDSGPGIAALNIPAVALTHGYSTAGTLGMGYKIMLSFADQVYLATGPEGTTVAIAMGLHAHTEASESVYAESLASVGIS